MIRQYLRCLRIFGAASITIFALNACTNADNVANQSEEVPENIATIAVEQRSLTSTVVVQGVVVPRPEYLIEAPEAGRIAFGDALDTNKDLETGQLLATVADQEIQVPAAGELKELLVADGTTIAARIPIVSVIYHGFGVLLEVPVTEQYRMYQGALSARVNITSGPSGLECQLVSPNLAPEIAETVKLLCLLPLDAQVASGLQAKAGLLTATRENVLTLPLSAVSGRVDQGEVTRLRADGLPETVTVQLGITDGVYLEILAGLQEGDQVLTNAPKIH